MPTLPQDLLNHCLCLAAQASDFATVHALIEAGAKDPHSKAIFALIPAIYRPNEDERLACLQALMPIANPEATIPDIRRPLLLHSALCGWVKGFELLASWANPALRDECGDGAAHVLATCAHGDLAPQKAEPMLNILANAAPSLEPQARQELDLIRAATEGDIPGTLSALDQGANPRAFCSDWTPLLAAVNAGHDKVARIIYSRDPTSILDVDSSRFGLLSLAAVGHSRACLDFALSVGDPNQADKDGDCALSLALSHGRWDFVLPLAKACDLSLVNSAGEGPMHWLASSSVSFDYNVPDDCPLERVGSFDDSSQDALAFARDLPQIFKLFASSPSAFSPNLEGQTALDMARSYPGYGAVGRWLEQSLLGEMALRERDALNQAACPPRRARARMGL